MKEKLTDFVAYLLMPFGHGWPIFTDFKKDVVAPALRKVTLATQNNWLYWTCYSRQDSRPYYATLLPDGTSIILESDGKVFGEIAHSVVSAKFCLGKDAVQLECSITEGKPGGPKCGGPMELKELLDVVYHLFHP